MNLAHKQWIALVCAIATAVGGAAAQSQFSEAELNRAFEGLKAYTGGEPTSAMDTVRTYVDEAVARYKIRVDAEERLLEVLRNRNVSRAAKNFAGEQLHRLCDEDSIGDLEDLLMRSDTSDIARGCLEKIPHPRAQRVLLDAIDAIDRSLIIGVMESLGERGDPSAVDALRRWSKAGNIPETEAALAALGKIPGREAMDALDWCRVNLTRPMRPAATDAYLQCGYTSLEAGQRDVAIELFENLLIDFEPIEVQARAMRGLIRAQGEDAVPTILEGLTSGIPEMEAIAAEEANRIEGQVATEALLDAYPRLTPRNQAILLRAFGERGDTAALDTVMLAAQSRIPEVRRAALDAAIAFNHPDTLQMLLKVAATGPPEEQQIAREALIGMEDGAVHDELLIAAMSADNAIRTEAVQTIAKRKMADGIPVLLRIAGRDVRPLRLEALRALGEVGTYRELEAMVGLMLDDWPDADRAAIGESVLAVARRTPEGELSVAPIADALKASKTSNDEKLTLISLLNALKDDAGLSALQEAARRESSPVRRASLEVLGAWPTPGPIDTLARVARDADDPAVRTLALDGLLRHLETTASGVAEPKRVDYYEDAAKVAETVEQRKRIVAGLQAISHPDSAKLLASLMEDSRFAQAARGTSEPSSKPGASS